MGFLLFPIYGLLMGLRLATLRTAGVLLIRIPTWIEIVILKTDFSEFFKDISEKEGI